MTVKLCLRSLVFGCSMTHIGLKGDHKMVQTRNLHDKLKERGEITYPKPVMWDVDRQTDHYSL